jgi:hypothetical protein
MTMSEYTDAVLAKFPDVPADIRQALADALAAAEKAQPGTKVGERSGTPAGAKASEGGRPDVALAAAADALVLSEGIDYRTALLRAAENDPELAKRYREDNFGAPDATPRAERPDVQLAERAKKLAEERSIPYGEAMTVVLAEDPDLAKRYKGA